jgi:hypothetical protein
MHTASSDQDNSIRTFLVILQKGSRLPRIRHFKSVLRDCCAINSASLPHLAATLLDSLFHENIDSPRKFLIRSLQKSLYFLTSKHYFTAPARKYQAPESTKSIGLLLSPSTSSHLYNFRGAKTYLASFVRVKAVFVVPPPGARPISHLGVPQSPSNKQLCVSKRPQLSNQVTINSQFSPPEPLRSSVGSWTAFIVVCVVAILYSVSPGAVDHQHTSPLKS